jgi:hypothetical protein
VYPRVMRAPFLELDIVSFTQRVARGVVVAGARVGFNNKEEAADVEAPCSKQAVARASASAKEDTDPPRKT